MKKDFTKIIIPIVVVVIVLLIAVFGLSKNKNKSSEISEDGVYEGTLKVGHLVAIDMAPLFIAKEAGYFADEGLDVETVFFSNPGDNNAALSGGSVQMTINPFTLAYLGVNSGVPMRIIANAGGDGVMQVVIQGEYNIDTVEEFVSYVKSNPDKKLKVGTLRGDTLDMILYKMFQENGLSYDDFEMIWFNDLLAMVQSFKTGDIDVLSHIQPYTTDLIVNFDAKFITDNSIVWGEGTPNTTLMVLDSFQEKYPETVRRFLRAELRAVELIKNNPKEAMKILSGKNYYRISDDVLLKALESQKNATLLPNREGIMSAISDMVKQNYIKLPSEEVIDITLLKEIMR
jgi:ABC-type nitrate/sulfonate/bicarbonate transport system substrate-binding protein